MDKHKNGLVKVGKNMLSTKVKSNTEMMALLYIFKISMASSSVGKRRNFLYKGLAIKIGTDVTDSRKAEIELKQSEERFRFISESTSDSIIVFEKAVVKYVSPAHAVQFGYSTEEAV
ncbi:MAG: PAS domain S-box protein [Arcicella sp.]|nr:PAS domain S-box protein [Arcicella sp.]